MSDYKELIEHYRRLGRVTNKRTFSDFADALEQLTAERDGLLSARNSAETRLHDGATHCATVEQQHDAALAVIEQMRTALCAYSGVVDAMIARKEAPELLVKASEFASKALAIQADLTALRKRDAETLRKAVKVCMRQQYDLRTRQTFSGAIRTLADRIEKGEAL